jgi:PmbA protein
VLEACYLDTYYARKLGERPTTGDASNVIVTPGDAGLGELIASIDRGVLVRGFLGGNSNPTTGDFSLGIHGTLIEKGALTAAVSEMNVAGNHLELWARLAAAGADVYPHSTIRSPSLLFDRVQLSGR